MLSNNRIKYIDIAKGIAIICIILGHFGIKWINSVVFTFHVPIFYIITGYLMNTKLPIKEFIKRRFKTLIIPYIITCIITIILASIISGVEKGINTIPKTAMNWLYASIYGSGIDFTKPFYIKKIGALWFLLASFWGNILLRLTLEIKHKSRPFVILAIFLVVGLWSRKLFWFPLSVQAGCGAMLYMYLGFLFNQAKEELQNLSPETKISVSILALLIWLEFIINFKSFSLVYCDIGRGAIDLFGSICGVYIICIISFYIAKKCKVLTKIFSFLGRYSIFVLCIHIIELNLFNWYKIIPSFITITNGLSTKPSLFSIIAFKLTFIVIVTYLCSKSKNIKKLFGIKNETVKLNVDKKQAE